MSTPKSDYVSDDWKDGLFSESSIFYSPQAKRILIANLVELENKVVFCTGGAGTICSAQVRALVHLGADACIVGRNVEKTERAAKDIASVRAGARVIGIGAVDVRKYDSLKDAAERCIKELGGIDFVMCVLFSLLNRFAHLDRDGLDC